MSVETPAAPAQPVTPAPSVSATFDAASRGDFGAFQDAEAKSKTGSPAPRVPVKAESPAAVADPPATETPAPTDATTPTAETTRQTSRRQQQINDYERRIFEQEQRIRSLESRLTPGQPAAPPAEPVPEWKRYAAMPGYPKLSDFESIEEHSAAASLFIDGVRQREQQQRAAGSAQAEDVQRQNASYAERMKPALDDETFAEAVGLEFNPAGHAVFTKLPELSGAAPLSVLPRGATATFANVAAEAVYRSEHPAALLRHLAANPPEVARIGALPPSQWLPALSRLDGALVTPPTPASVPSAEPPPANPVSQAPPPVPKVTRAGASTDPKAAALARGDFATFDQLEREDRMRKRGHRGFA